MQKLAALAELARITHDMEAAELRRRELIRFLREPNPNAIGGQYSEAVARATWEQIGEAIGATKQAVSQRYGVSSTPRNDAAIHRRMRRLERVEAECAAGQALSDAAAEASTRPPLPGV